MLDGLKSIVPEGRVLCGESMSRHTSFKIGGPAEVLAIANCDEEIKGVVDYCRTKKIPLTVIGGGTNVLASDAGISGVTLKIRQGSAAIAVDGDRIDCGGGVALNALANAAHIAGLGGFEFASGIPGTVGGALYMNAGAYDREISDILISARVLAPDGTIAEYEKKDLMFSYRRSVLQANGGIALSAVFLGYQMNPEEIRAKMDGLNERRRETQPLEYPSAGSAFKRPSGNFAGSLISDCGLRGFAIGGAKVSEKHAGFIINEKNATADDVARLIGHIVDAVYGRFGIMLEPEIKLIGFGKN
ncbi:MAG: UDP-N-acetylmuramate dehydrogenase [Defluviitaleaceae bacterium]|nr:UDP-N-acetylmuramate dehydrogenase [Defluviitaleaceae bacterium]